MIVREGVEGLDEQLSLFLLEMHVADRAVGDASAGVERIDHALGRRTLAKLRLQHPKHIGCDTIQFELRGVSQASFALNLFGVFASQTHFEQFALLRQRLLDGSDDLGHGGAAAAGEGDHMPIAGDVDASAVVGSGNQTGAMVVEKFRMD